MAKGGDIDARKIDFPCLERYEMEFAFTLSSKARTRERPHLERWIQ